MQLKLERIYTKPVDTDGYRVLVDRLWPRGISKVNAQLDNWVKEIGPSTTYVSGSIMNRRNIPDLSIVTGLNWMRIP